jgi:hypothetical protein
VLLEEGGSQKRLLLLLHSTAMCLYIALTLPLPLALSFLQAIDLAYNHRKNRKIKRMNRPEAPRGALGPCIHSIYKIIAKVVVFGWNPPGRGGIFSGIII